MSGAGTSRVIDAGWHPLAGGIAPAWASGWGHDRHGVFAEFAVFDVVTRLRWISPGRFEMGSPDGEPGHIFDEGPQLEVVLAPGYWLMDAPVTQALWKAVTGENPSRFVSDERPVERVGWREAQTFIGAVNKGCPGLELRLPSEAEWEYACRAGTRTATYAGPMAIHGENNAPILDGIAWYGGNSGVDFELAEGEDSSDWVEKQHDHGRAGTRPVKLKAPNGWGLYDMLGNVWEWCADGWSASHAGADPTGDPRSVESSERTCVVRGGGWSDPARSVRAASRGRFAPAVQFDFLGFRCAGGRVTGFGGLATRPTMRGSGVVGEAGRSSRDLQRGKSIKCPFVDGAEASVHPGRDGNNRITLTSSGLGRSIKIDDPAWTLIRNVYGSDDASDATLRGLGKELGDGPRRDQLALGLFTLSKVFSEDFQGVEDLLVPMWEEGTGDEISHRTPGDTRTPDEIVRDDQVIAEHILRKHGRSKKSDRLVVGKGELRRRWVGFGDEFGIGPFGGGWVKGDVPEQVNEPKQVVAEFDFDVFGRIGRQLVATAHEHLGHDGTTLIGRLVSAAPRYARAKGSDEFASAALIAKELGLIWRDVVRANFPEAVWWDLQEYQEMFEAQFAKLDDLAARSDEPDGWSRERLDEYTQKLAIARDRATPQEVLQGLSHSLFEEVRQAVASNPSSPADVLSALSVDNAPDVRRAIAANSRTPPEDLDEMSKDPLEEIRAAIAANESAWRHTLERLAGGKDGTISLIARRTLSRLRRRP